MNESLPPSKSIVQPATRSELDYLKEIAESLKSIRSMLNFFTIILVLVIAGQILSFFLSVLSR